MLGILLEKLKKHEQVNQFVFFPEKPETVCLVPVSSSAAPAPSYLVVYGHNSRLFLDRIVLISDQST